MKKSFACAFRGVLACIKSERNMRIHMAVAFYVLLAAVVTGAGPLEWISLLICFALVMGAELFNTSLEKLCDVAHPGLSDAVGKIKDMAAGAVLVSAVFSAAVGSVIFFNVEKFEKTAVFAQKHIVLTVIIILTVPVNAYLAFRRYRQ